MRPSIMFPIVCFCATTLSCGQSAESRLKGQTNTTLTYYAQVVDQDGKPLEGARFEYRVEAYPKDWTFDTRGRPNNISSVTVTSDKQGRFRFDVEGCQLYRMKADCAGYRHLYDLDVGDSRAVDNTGYRLISWSDLCYKADPDHPAVLVFVKEGANEVSALPCRGGYDSGNGKHWKENEPGWPKKPSLTDVVRKQASTGP